ncbi:hypothetical protein GDO81_018572 [Engystomops pustulosus]|uniref:Uncharacterized protein n=1 Tax=Engystomops pustulosus TaxID=76066 RepID=A0AAV6YB34_ENGPU|nr:hypothetical protein GDO81_018572 [Engystomops pustulosus]
MTSPQSSPDRKEAVPAAQRISAALLYEEPPRLLSHISSIGRMASSVLHISHGRGKVAVGRC